MRPIATTWLLIILLLAGCTAPPTAPGPAAPLPEPTSPGRPKPEPASPEPQAPEGPKEPVLPGTWVWAVDPTGQREPELLLQHEKPLAFRATSPDGRWWLLIESLGEYKGDYRAIPYIYDQSTGEWKQGPQIDQRGAARWSGHGFFINRMLHMDLNFQLDGFDAIRETLGLKAEERELIDFSTADDGLHYAALAGHPWNDQTALDLVIGTLDGAEPVIVPEAIPGAAFQIGVLAYARLSPDGQWLFLMGRESGYLLPVAEAADREAWIPLPHEWREANWSPDSQSVEVGGIVYDLTGKAVGEGGPDAVAEGVAPEGSWLVATLPDGRLLMTRVVYTASVHFFHPLWPLG